MSAEAWVEELNREWFIAEDEGQAVVCREVKTDEGKALRYMTPASFALLYANRKVQGNSDKMVPMGAAWLRHPERRQYLDGIVFAPPMRDKRYPNDIAMPSVHPDLQYNTWQGWDHLPPAGPADWSMLQQHMFESMCGADQAAFDYLLNLLAFALRFPGETWGVALVLQGGMGTGKGVLGRLMCELLGPHAMHLSRGSQLSGNFNGHLENKSLIFADEAVFAGSGREADALKAMVTEPRITIEPKFRNAREVPNRLKIIMATNHDHAIQMEADDRRYLVLKCDDKRSPAFWVRLHDDMRKGGAHAFFTDMLDRDLSDFDPRKIPQTEGGAEQKLRSLDPCNEWLLHCLREGVIAGEPWTEGARPSIHGPTLYADYAAHARTENRAARLTPLNQLPRRLGKVLGCRVESRTVRRKGGEAWDGETWSGDRRKEWDLPPLDKAREGFTAWLGVKVAWDDSPPGCEAVEDAA